MRTQVDTIKEKTKSNNQQKLGEDLMQRRLNGNKMTINNNKEDLR